MAPYVSVFLPLDSPYSGQLQNVHLTLEGFQVYSMAGHNWVWVSHANDAIHFDVEKMTSVYLKALAGPGAIVPGI